MQKKEFASLGALGDLGGEELGRFGILSIPSFSLKLLEGT